MTSCTRRCAALGMLAATAIPATLAIAAPANADNRRFNDAVVANVHTMQMLAGCADNYVVEPMVRINPKLRLAAQWHTNDVLNNRDLDGDIGSDGSTTTDRARNAGYNGVVTETVAVNPALSMSGVELINQWFYRPDYHTIMSDCSNVDIGVWSENSLDRTVVVAVYGKGDGEPPVMAPGRQFGQRPPTP